MIYILPPSIPNAIKKTIIHIQKSIGLLGEPHNLISIHCFLTFETLYNHHSCCFVSHHYHYLITKIWLFVLLFSSFLSLQLQLQLQLLVIVVFINLKLLITMMIPLFHVKILYFHCHFFS